MKSSRTCGVVEEVAGVGGEADVASRELVPALGALPGHLLWRASARVASALQTVLPPGVDIHAYAALLALAGGAVRSQQELAETLVVSPTTMTRTAALLVTRGLVDRVRNPADRRSYALSRTSAGAATARRWGRHVQGVELAVTATLTDDERARLHELLLGVATADLPPDLPDGLRRSTSFLLTRLQQRMHREFADPLTELGLEPRHFGSLVALDALGPVPQALLARSLGVSGPTVVQIADQLEARGLVQRRRPPADRRTQLLHLLPEGRAALASATDIVGVVDRRLLAPLSTADREALLGLLRRLVTDQSA